MYAVKDFHGTRGHASSVESYSPYALKFMGLIQPWIRAGGSALDVEEAMFQLDLPTNYRGWSKLSPNEITMAMALGKVFNALARTAFMEAGADVITQIVPSIGPYVSGPNSVNAPLQFAVNINAGTARDATEIEFTAAPAAYAALQAAGALDIATTNDAIRTAGLLGSGENAIEVGEKRVVIRKEIAENFLSADLKSANARESIPWLTGLEVMVRGQQADVTVNAGTVTEDMVLYHSTDSSRSVTISRYIAGAPNRVRVRSVTGTAPIATDVYVNGDLSVNVTFDSVLSSVDLLGASLPVLSGDPNNAAPSPNGSPYPYISAVLTSTLQADVAYVGYEFAQGVALSTTPGGAQTYLKPEVLQDSRERLEAGLVMLAAEYNLVSRGVITAVKTTYTAAQTALRGRQLYASAQDAMSGAQRVTFTYSAGNGTAPAVDDIASFGNIRGTVTRVSGDGTSGVMDVMIYLGSVAAQATGTVTTDGGSSQTVVAADVTYGLPGFIGDPSSISHAGDIEGLTPIGEYGLDLAHLSACYLLLYGGGGGTDLFTLGEDFQLPSAQNFTNNKRHCFAACAQAWLEKIDIDNAADSVLFGNTSQAMQTLGWPSWSNGTAQERAAGLLAVDPALWERYMNDLALVASGESLAPVFRVRDSVEGIILGQGINLRPGEIGMVPISPVDGQSEARFTVQFRVPTDFGTNLGNGSIRITVPDGVASFVNAAYLPTAPATTATSSIGGSNSNVLTLTFDDNAGAGYAAGALVSLAEVTMRAGARYAGDPGRGTAVKIERFSGWAAMGGAIDYVTRFDGVRMSVLTELP